LGEGGDDGYRNKIDAGGHSLNKICSGTTKTEGQIQENNAMISEDKLLFLKH
jgi:hypothetical protein